MSAISESAVTEKEAPAQEPAERAWPPEWFPWSGLLSITAPVLRCACGEAFSTGDPAYTVNMTRVRAADGDGWTRDVSGNDVCPGCTLSLRCACGMVFADKGGQSSVPLRTAAAQAGWEIGAPDGDRCPHCAWTGPGGTGRHASA